MVEPSKLIEGEFYWVRKKGEFDEVVVAMAYFWDREGCWLLSSSEWPRDYVADRVEIISHVPRPDIPA